MGPSITVLLLLVCLLFSAFFSALEMALASISPVRLKKLTSGRSIHSYALTLWSSKSNFVLSTILIGNNIVNALAASLATVLMQSIFNDWAISAATFFITITIVVVGEITPKTFARHNAEKIATIFMSVLLPIYVVLWPVVWVMNAFASKIMNLLGKKPPSEAYATEDEIAYLIKLGEQEGSFEKGENHLLQSVIEFRETVVKESMVPRTEICSFDVNTPYEEVITRINNEGHTRWPVYENNIDNIIGVFHTKDLLRQNLPLNIKDFSLRSFLRPAKFVPDMMKIGALLKEFQAGKIHLAIVVDEYGGTAGIISLEDVLEEIVGEIRDEYDDEESEKTIDKIDNYNYLVNGKAKISDLEKALDINFPDSDTFDSLGGFLVALHGRVPKVGTEFNYGGCTFAVKAADEKKISLVSVFHPPSKNSAQVGQSVTFKERAAA